MKETIFTAALRGAIMGLLMLFVWAASGFLCWLLGV